MRPSILELQTEVNRNYFIIKAEERPNPQTPPPPREIPPTSPPEPLIKGLPDKDSIPPPPSPPQKQPPSGQD